MAAIKDFLTHYFNKDQPKPPPISAGTAAALLVIYTLIYVVPFYLSSATRPSRTLSRDAPSVIRARITLVSLTCIVCSLITLRILTLQNRVTNGEALHSMGYWPLGLPEAAKSLLLTAILFSGPLYETLLVEGQWRRWLSLQPISELLTSWIPWRNVIAGPLTEEVLFRSAAVPLMLVAQTSVVRTIFLSPLIFGLAHVHHFYEFRLTHPHDPITAAFLRSLLQLTYTSLFGAYATFLFLRTGSLLAIFVVHAFCNIMGLPRFWGRVEPPSDAESSDGKDGWKAGVQAPKASILWSVFYYLLLVGGAVGFWRNLGALTESDNALIIIAM
ncbi:CaaX protease [Xylaria nigripes]|nr:CaaX protease [Xylaria nigripes]